MKMKGFLTLSVLSLVIILLFASWQVAAEKPNYYIDISLFPEGYAKFKIDVNNYNLGDVIILPTLKCEDNFTNISDLRRKLKITDIRDNQTYEGLISLNNSCMGVGITRPQGNSTNSTISFTYRNFDWKWHPEDYPLDSYEMPILISFPEIRTYDSIMVSIRISLPPNMVVKNSSAYLLWEHPTNKRGEWNKDLPLQDKQGNQQIIVFEKSIFLKDNPTPAIYMPLEFEREDFFLQYSFYIIIGLLMVILILFSVLILKTKNNDLGILTVVAVIFSSYQLLSPDKPAGVTTTLDKLFLLFIGWSLLLFILHMVSKLVDLQTIIVKLWKKSRLTAEVKVKRGEKSWNFIYLVFVFIWTITVSIISIIPTDWLYKTTIILIVTLILSWLCFFNPWFQNKILGLKIKLEEWRKIQ